MKDDTLQASCKVLAAPSTSFQPTRGGPLPHPCPLQTRRPLLRPAPVPSILSFRCQTTTQVPSTPMRAYCLRTTTPNGNGKRLQLDTRPARTIGKRPRVNISVPIWRCTLRTGLSSNVKNSQPSSHCSAWYSRPRLSETVPTGHWQTLRHHSTGWVVLEWPEHEKFCSIGLLEPMS